MFNRLWPKLLVIQLKQLSHFLIGCFCLCQGVDWVFTTSSFHATYKEYVDKKEMEEH